MQAPSALGRIVDLVRDLRARCPWDRAQTPETLRPYLMEEVFELDHAIGEGDAESIRVELGDLLLHLAFQIVLAEERGDFGPEDLTRQVETKMWRRHPHLFPAAPAERNEDGPSDPPVSRSPDPPSAEQVKANWEKLKLREREHEEAPSVLDGVPPNLPALIAAFRLQERAAGVGFDWPDWHGPLDKIREETGELADELGGPHDPERLAHEVGDLLFAAVNVARKIGVDPRAALEGSNRRFVQRFTTVERLARARGVDVHTAGLEVLDALWEEAKKGG